MASSPNPTHSPTRLSSSNLPRQSPTRAEEGACKIYRRPGSGTKGELLDLLANWYELKCRLDGKEIYQYKIEFAVEVKGSRGKISRRKIEKNRGLIRHCFWECVRSHRDVFGSHFRIVFDDVQSAFSLERWKFHERKVFKINVDKQVFVITATEDTLFVFNLASEVVVDRTLSTHMANIIFTQRTRYAPAIRDDEECAFVAKWETYRTSIYHIPQYGSDSELTGPVIAPGVRAWLGAYTSVRTLQNSNYALAFGLMNSLFYELNMDLITFYFYVREQGGYKGDSTRFEKELENMGMDHSQRRHMTDRLQGVRVKTDKAILCVRGKYQFAERHGTFECLLDYPPGKCSLPNGKSMLEAYFYMKSPVRYQWLPLCQIRVGKKTVEVPLEFVYIHDKPQRYTKMLSPSMKAEFIKKVCRKPDEHKRLTDKLFEMMEFTKSPSFINSFLFDVRPEMIRCKGLLLEPPVAIDKERNPVEMTPIRAIKKKELNEPPDGEIVIAVLVMQGKQSNRDPSRSCVSNEEAGSFFKNLVEKCGQRGMSVASEPLRVYFNVEAEREEFKRVVKDASDRFSKLADGKILLLLVINEEQNIPDRNMIDKGPSYGLIKSVCDNEHGIASQVVDASTVRKATSIGEKTIYYNIALKINAKLGGVNQAVVFDDESQSAEVSDKDAVMYVGIDVTHPTNLSTIDISIASIVANVDLAATRYTNEIMAQMAARETVERFETQFGRLMTKFHEHSKVWPRHIVIFRDGVSDSEMLRTAFIELKCIRDSWNKLTFEDPQLEPTFTYIVIQKRHLTRFYQPTNNDKGEGTYVNVSSGTVVDNVVVSPTFFDFYLASQIGALGTTRPAHYTVVRDDWMLTPDKIYEMCYRLCFLYARCRIPVSLPCPVYYAHRVCEKAKEVYKSLDSAHTFDGLSEMEKKQKIEQCLTVPENYPGMHFV